MTSYTSALVVESTSGLSKSLVLVLDLSFLVRSAHVVAYSFWHGSVSLVMQCRNRSRSSRSRFNDTTGRKQDRQVDRRARTGRHADRPEARSRPPYVTPFSGVGAWPHVFFTPLSLFSFVRGLSEPGSVPVHNCFLL